MAKQPMTFPLWRKRWQLVFAATLVMTLVFQGCGCEPDLPPPKPKAEINLSEINWNISDNPPAGIKLYKKFTIKNKAAAGSEDLEIKSIKLEDDSGQFKLIESKDSTCNPPGPDSPCKESECLLYSNNEALCVTVPLSLPTKLAGGNKEEFSFVMEYKPNATGISPQAKLIINSNTENNKNEEFVDTSILLGARGGEAVIEVSGTNIQPGGTKDFNMPMGKTNKGETKKDTFKISNLGDADLTFTLTWEKKDDQFAITTADGKKALDVEFTLPGAAQAPNNAMEFEIAYTPADCGDHEVRLSIKSNAVRKKLDDKGEIYSGSSLFIRPTGSSPTGATVDPGTLSFGDIKIGESATRKFTLAIGPTGLCDVIVYDISIAPLQAGGDTKDFSFGDMLKDGSKVSAPTQASPITIKKGEKLEVAVVFSPSSKQPSSGVIKIKTNDPSFDPEDNGAVNLSAGVERNDKPIARLRFKCGEENSTACTKDSDLAGQIFLGGEKSVKVILDASKSTDDQMKIVGYKFELTDKPPLAGLTVLNNCGDPKDLSDCHFVVTQSGEYKVKLTVTDDAGQSSSVDGILKVDP